MAEIEAIPFRVDQKLKKYTNEAHPQFSEDPEYDMTWDEQYAEFRKGYSDGWLKESFIDEAIGN